MNLKWISFQINSNQEVHIKQKFLSDISFRFLQRTGMKRGSINEQTIYDNTKDTSCYRSS